jgi:protein O-mannosyl-transferase
MQTLRRASTTSRLPLILVIVMPVLALWPVVTAEFIPLDDPANVSRNPDYNPPALAKLGHYWTGPFLNMYAPLTYTAWAGVARLGWMDSVDHGGIQLNPYVFHAANLLLHIVCAVLVYAILRKLTARAWAACGGALLFALHPMQVEPVAWVTGFRDLLAAIFSLAALLAYLNYATRERRARSVSYGFACFFLLAALLSKPTSVVVPLLAAAIDWGVLGRPWREVIKPLSVMLLLAIPFAVMTKLFQSADITYTPPLWSRPIIAADALGFYAAKVVFPLRVGLDYGRSPRWLLDQPGLGWLWIILVPVGVALWKLRRRRWVVAGFVIMAASLLPVLGLTKFDFQHHSTVADRYIYLGMLGPALLLAFAVSNGGRTTAIMCGVLLVLLAARSHAQSYAWKNGESIYNATLETNPNSLIATRGLGLIALSDGRRADAEALFAATLRAHPDDAVTHFHLGNLYVVTGRAKEAVPHLRVAVATLETEAPSAVTNLATALTQIGQLADARRVLEDALAKNPKEGRAELHAMVAEVRFRQGDRAGAAEHYRAALRINPDFAYAAAGLAAIERAPTTTPVAPATRSAE